MNGLNHVPVGNPNRYLNQAGQPQQPRGQMQPEQVRILPRAHAHAVPATRPVAARNLTVNAGQGQNSVQRVATQTLQGRVVPGQSSDRR